MVDAPKFPHPHFRKRTWVVTTALAATLAALLLALAVSGPTVRTAAQRPVLGRHHVAAAAAASPQIAAVSDGIPATGDSPSPGATSVPPVAVAPATIPVATTIPVAPAPTNAPVVQPVSVLVGEVEASGMEPGSNWNWIMGDTATYCGPISGAGTGCTYGEAGLEHTIFAGTPTLALVAHELANAETQNDAVPSLLSEVAAAAAGTSWSPTDAVASCLVVHFMGFQDNAAGTWQCPVALAATVAEHIHDTY